MIGKPGEHSTVVVSETLRVAKTAAEIQNPKIVYFENVLMPINPPLPSAAFERWWGAVHPTFVVWWDHPETGLRAYQFIKPDSMHASTDEVKNHPGCDNFRDADYIQILDVSFPHFDIRDDIDEVLPRPATPE